MDFSTFDNGLADIFSKEKLKCDFLSYARTEFIVLDDFIEISAGSRIYRVPLDFELDVVARVIQVNYFPVYSEARIVIAIGGVLNEDCGVVTPKFFLAKLNYREGTEPYNVDLDFW
jgi:hypothetical protein